MILLIAAANRDPEIFTDPDRFAPYRGSRHLAFGLGQHFCSGAPLARMEASITLGCFARRVREPDLTHEHPHNRDHVTLRGPATLVPLSTAISPQTARTAD